MVQNHWDSDVTSKALGLLSLVSTHHALFLIVLIAYAALHIFNSLLLILGALLCTAFLAGCPDEEGDEPTPPMAELP